MELFAGLLVILGFIALFVVAIPLYAIWNGFVASKLWAWQYTKKIIDRGPFFKD